VIHKLNISLTLRTVNIENLRQLIVVAYCMLLIDSFAIIL